LSSLQAKVEPSSLAPKEKLAAVAVVLASGPAEMAVSGAVVSAGGVGSGSGSDTGAGAGSGSGVGAGSGVGTGAGSGAVTVQLSVAGVASVFPAASVARTETWCERSASDEYDFGEAQLLHLPPSSLQAKVDLDSLEVNEKLAVVAVVLAAGPLVIEVLGAVVSRLGLNLVPPVRESAWRSRRASLAVAQLAANAPRIETSRAPTRIDRFIPGRLSTRLFFFCHTPVRSGGIHAQ
jgi:hypothetical protein